MAGRPISVRSNSRNAVAELRAALAPYRSGQRKLPDGDYEEDEVWRWVHNGLEDSPALLPLWTDEIDIAAMMLFGDWMSRNNGLVPEAIYVISAGDGISKIGVSSTPASRLEGLQTSNAHPLSIKALLWADRRPRVVESAALELARQRGKRLRGEWVEADTNGALAMIFEAAALKKTKLTPAVGMMGSYLRLLEPDFHDYDEDPEPSETSAFLNGEINELRASLRRTKG